MILSSQNDYDLFEYVIVMVYTMMIDNKLYYYSEYLYRSLQNFIWGMLFFFYLEVNYIATLQLHRLLVVSSL